MHTGAGNNQPNVKTGGKRRGKKLQVLTQQAAISSRLDSAIPLNTKEWQKVEQNLMRILEFAPAEIILEVANAIASYADDQARRGYLLGQADLQSLAISDIA
ncbi:MAG: hypothetical protein IPJ49_06640 [Candidatus Obscuribacter sp.]|nr:hypothetical protein [Candidatus Obscuribacter sp.]